MAWGVPPGRRHHRWPHRLTSSGSALLSPWDLRGVVLRMLARVSRGGGGGPPRVVLVVRRRCWPLRPSRAAASAPVTAESWDLSVACMLSSHGSAEAPCSRRQMLRAASRVDRRIPKLLPRSRQPRLNRRSCSSWFSYLHDEFPVSLTSESCAATANSSVPLFAASLNS